LKDGLLHFSEDEDEIKKHHLNKSLDDAAILKSLNKRNKRVN